MEETDFNGMNKQVYAVDFSQEKKPQKEYKNRVKPLTVCAIVGLILNFFYGAGIIFSAISCIFSYNLYKKTADKNYFFAAVLGFVGFIISALFITLLILK